MGRDVIAGPVPDMLGFTLQHHPRAHVVFRIKRVACIREFGFKPVWRCHGDLPPGLAVGAPGNSKIAIHKMRGGAHDGFEYRCRVIGGLADHTKDFRACCLPRERGLCFVEKLRVLDRNHGLIGKRF